MDSSTIFDACAWSRSTSDAAGIDSAPAKLASTELLGLQRALLAAVAAASSRDELLNRVAAHISQLLKASLVVYFERDASGELRAVAVPTDEAPILDLSGFADCLSACSENACRQGQVCAAILTDADSQLALAAPVFAPGRRTEAFAAIVPRSSNHIDAAIAVIQLAAAHLLIWHSEGETKQLQEAADASTAIVELTAKMESAETLEQGCVVMVNELQQHLGCKQVALGLCRWQGKAPCRLAAVSGISEFDRRGDTARAMESVLDEALLRDSLSIWPSKREADRHALLAHEKMCSAVDAHTIVSCPLRNEQGELVGAYLIYDFRPIEANSSTIHLLRAAERSLAATLDLLRRSGWGITGRTGRWLARQAGSWKGRLIFTAVCLGLATLCLPVTHRIKCDCQIEPATRRYVSAPFAGTLEKAFVQPGDLVQRGDVLAQMDEREIRWELAELDAQLKQAEKSRDMALAERKFAAAQVHKLEMKGIQLKIQVLRKRGEHLEIKSPINGIVTSGDLERAEGATLKVGQTLFEVAPLDNMIFEIAVPDSDISHVRDGLPVQIHLDAYANRNWQATVAKLQPRSELRDNQNVFIAEVPVSNADGELRPGMKGRAKVEGARRPLGWILFHKPWRALSEFFW